MHIYTKIYQFAASLGALEGFVYQKSRAEDLGLSALTVWIDNICLAYEHLPAEALSEFHYFIDRTVGRALHSLIAVLGEEHELVIKLGSLIRDAENMPESADDFNKRKWFQE